VPHFCSNPSTSVRFTSVIQHCLIYLDETVFPPNFSCFCTSFLDSLISIFIILSKVVFDRTFLFKNECLGSPLEKAIKNLKISKKLAEKGSKKLFFYFIPFLKSSHLYL
ncbi:hypothetical protein H312_01963, partial [Anncaliia algerae PRA339]